jgi:hypothetical protein
VIGNLPWFALILAIGIFKENRDYRIFYLLIALLAVNLIWYLFKTVTDSAISSTVIEFDVTFQSFSIGLAVLWLTMHKFSDYNGLTRYFLGLAVMTFVLFLSIRSTYPNYSTKTAQIFSLCFFISIFMLFGFSLTGKYCKKQYRPKTFILWLALFMPVCGIAAMIGYIIFECIVTNSFPDPIVLIMVLVSGFISGILIYALNVPFLIMGFVSPFFRERFCNILRLKPVDEIDVLDET